MCGRKKNKVSQNLKIVNNIYRYARILRGGNFMEVRGLKPVKDIDIVPRGKYKPVALQLIKQFKEMPDEWAEIDAKFTSKNEMMRFYDAFKDLITKLELKKVMWIHTKAGKLYLRKI